MASDPNGWPDPARPGYPANPERDGPRWLRPKDGLDTLIAVPWSAARALWDAAGIEVTPSEAAAWWTYLGPCLTPAEVAAAVQAERDACAAWHDSRVQAMDAQTQHERENPAPGSADRIRLNNGCALHHASSANAIRARGDTSAPDAALAQARRDGMEEAARIVKRMRLPTPWSPAAQRFSEAADRIEAAIRRGAAGEACK